MRRPQPEPPSPKRWFSLRSRHPNPWGAPPPAFDSVDPEQAWESAFLTSSLVMPKLLVPGTLRTPGCKWRGKTGQMSSQGFACG